MGAVVHASNPSYLEGRGRRITSLRSAWAKLGRLCLKNKIQRKAQVVEQLLTINKALSSIPRKREREQKKERGKKRKERNA
jgi:hypothetical protein